MEHEGEIWQELDFNGEKLRGIVPAKLDKNKVRLFYGAAVMLYRYKDGGVEYLFQHRSKKLKGNPDKWDVSAGGHVNIDEDQIDAIIREAKEEIGINLDKNRLEIAASYLCLANIFISLYFYDFTNEKDNFAFNDQEAEEVKWIKYSKLKNFWPSLKKGLVDDKIFEYYLKEWHQKILKKYENN